jgi:hypothetical protein
MLSEGEKGGVGNGGYGVGFDVVGGKQNLLNKKASEVCPYIKPAQF